MQLRWSRSGRSAEAQGGASTGFLSISGRFLGGVTKATEVLWDSECYYSRGGRARGCDLLVTLRAWTCLGEGGVWVPLSPPRPSPYSTPGTW